VDGDNAAVSVTTMEQAIAQSLVGPRFGATLLGLFSALALALTVAGVFGVVAQAVTRQRRELAVRIAVGAGTRDVLRLVLVRGGTPVSIGLALGLAGAAALSRLLSSQLFGVSPTDPSTFATVALVVAATALLACYLPARRAARVDPVAALRAD
jgi:putative ABC transport system permease protein